MEYADQKTSGKHERLHYAALWCVGQCWASLGVLRGVVGCAVAGLGVLWHGVDCFGVLLDQCGLV